MSRFGECFFLIFGQLAVGGLIGMAVPDFRQLERGFYKSSAGIFLGFALIFIGARTSLVMRQAALTPAVAFELAVWLGFVLALATYLALLWRDAPRPRARAFAASVLLGFAAVIASSISYRPDDLAGVWALFYVIPFVTSALSLGSVAAGMLLGHWYLIDLGLSIEPLKRLHRLYTLSTLWHLAALLLVPVLVWAVSTEGAAAVEALLTTHRNLFLTRLLLGPLPALGIAWLIHRTLVIPQTMAATGLFYIAILFVLVGEMVGRLVLFRTGLPL